MHRMGHSSAAAALRYQHTRQAVRDAAIAAALTTSSPQNRRRRQSYAPVLRTPSDRSSPFVVARAWPKPRLGDQYRVRGGSDVGLTCIFAGAGDEIELAFSAWEADVLPLNYTRWVARGRYQRDDSASPRRRAVRVSVDRALRSVATAV